MTNRAMMPNRASSSYQGLIGKKNWSKLHPAIQKRFANDEKCAVIYRGVMQKVERSMAGRLFANVCRLIGKPLALHSGKNIPMTVKVYPNSSLGGMTWERRYEYPNQEDDCVKSTKVIKGGEGLVEVVGFGFGMKLKVYQKQGAIFFESEHYFWQLGNWKLVIPDILTPGKTVVYQRAINHHEFEFSLKINHPILGCTFEQIGTFRER